VKTLDDGLALVIPPPPIQGIGNVSGANMKVELRDGSFDYAQLEYLAQAITGRASQQSMFQVARNSFRADSPQLKIVVGCQVEDARRASRQCAGHAQLLCRLELHQPVQQVRPSVPDLCAGGSHRPLAAGISQDLDRAQRGIEQAAIAAARSRFRPILMTSFAFILGVVALVLGSGAGANAQKSIGIAVLPGMLGSTLLTVAFVPSIFVVLQRFEEWRKQRSSVAPRPVS
jgi:multidrug efflux pump subunit AcrB